MKNKFKQKLRDLCWYKTCYADGLREKDREPYANAMADEEQAPKTDLCLQDILNKLNQ